MTKPTQSKYPQIHSDNGDLRYALDEAMFHVQEAMEELKGYSELADFFDTLNDLHDDMYKMFEEVETNISVERAEMIREQERDYYRGLL